MPVSFFLCVHLFPFSLKTRDFFNVENVPIENFESNNGRYALPISRNFCYHSFLSFSLSGHIYLTFLSTPSVCQLYVPPNCSPHLSLMTFHFPFASLLPRLLPLLCWYNVKVVKLKPMQPAKCSSCVSYCTHSKSHWVGQRLGTNPLCNNESAMGWSMRLLRQ